MFRDDNTVSMMEHHENWLNKMEINRLNWPINFADGIFIENTCIKKTCCYTKYATEYDSEISKSPRKGNGEYFRGIV